MKKVLLLNLPFARLVNLQQDYLPLALWHLSTLLRSQNFEPFIKNLNIAKDLHYVNYADRSAGYSNLMSLYNSQKAGIYEELSNTIQVVKPDIIGITVLTAQIKIANDIIAYLKFHYDIPIFCGGAGATLDYIKIQGANLTFMGGVGHLRILNDIADYENTVFADQFSLEHYTGELNFDNIVDKYSNNAYGHVFSSIGCYGNCRFCASPAIWHRKVYFKPMQAFLHELELIADKYKPSKFQIWDENFTVSTIRLREFCKQYKLDIPWMCDSRIDSLNEDKIYMMKQAGCTQVAVGAESGCDRVLKYLNKGIDKARIKKTIDLLNAYELKSKIYMITGFPDESEAEMIESIEFIKSCKPTSIVLSLFCPYKNTSLYEECHDKGLIDNDYDESNYSHQSGNFMKKIHSEIDITSIIKSVDDYNKCLLPV
jgi:radical SAM superfamily enzyme